MSDTKTPKKRKPKRKLVITRAQTAPIIEALRGGRQVRAWHLFTELCKPVGAWKFSAAVGLALRLWKDAGCEPISSGEAQIKIGSPAVMCGLVDLLLAKHAKFTVWQGHGGFVCSYPAELKQEVEDWYDD